MTSDDHARLVGDALFMTIIGPNYFIALVGYHVIQLKMRVFVFVDATLV